MMKKKGFILFVVVALMITVLSGCEKAQTTIKDRTGNDITLPKEVNRIISTAPSNTNILAALGLGDKIVAIDDYSKGIEGLSESIATIDFMNPDAEAIMKLKPDMIIASGLSATGQEDPFRLIKEAGSCVVYIPSSDSIQSIYDDIKFLSEITHTEEKGEEMIQNMKSEIDKIKKVGDSITDKKRVYFELSPAPSIFTFGKGTFMNEMIEIIGATNVFADQGVWVQVSEEAVLKENPDVILTNVDYIENPIEEIKGREGWSALKAVSDNQIYCIDSNSSNQPSQNIVKAMRQMAKAVYPDKYE